MVNKNIIVIDDDPICCEIIEMALKATDCNVFSFTTGYSALNFLNESKMHISAVLLDIMMPEMSGTDFIKIAKKDDHIKSIPIIVQSGTHEEELNEAMNLGAFECIQKPFSQEKMIKTIEKAIGSKIHYISANDRGKASTKKETEAA